MHATEGGAWTWPASAPTVFLLDACVSAVGERAAATVAEACDIILIAAEVLDLRLRLEAAVPVVYNLHGTETQGDAPPPPRILVAQHAPWLLTCQMISSFCIPADYCDAAFLGCTGVSTRVS